MGELAREEGDEDVACMGLVVIPTVSTREGRGRRYSVCEDGNRHQEADGRVMVRS